MEHTTHSLSTHHDPNTSNIYSSRTQHGLLPSPLDLSIIDDKSLRFTGSSAGSTYPYTRDSERVAHSLNTRPRSPDAVSRVSTTSSLAAGGPQLRKKPKSISIKNSHTRKSAVPPRSQSLHTSQPSTDDRVNITNTVPAANSGKPLLRADSSSSQQHSPQNKRPPASHSSYGVETTCGPPPSYSTQRTISQERIKKVDRNTILRGPSTQESTPTTSIYESQEFTTPANTVQNESSVTSLVHSSPDTADTQSVPTPTETDAMASVDIRTDREFGGGIVVDDSKGSSSDERKSEDLFLNIARIDAVRPNSGKTDRRRSRISLPFLSASRSIHDIKSSPVQSPMDIGHVPSSQTEAQRYFSKRSSLGGHAPGALSRTNLQESMRLRDRSMDPPSDVEHHESRLGRYPSNANMEGSRLSQRGSQGLRNMRLASESAYAPKSVEHFATESTVSTTAPSTVWDELDDLKSRIRKLELTGKLPPSSAAAMSTTERPRTATTAATTMSTSPRYKSTGTALQSTMEGISPNMHPLLHEALGNAKQVLSNDIYQKLHATAQDALQLAAMMSQDNHDVINNFVTPNTERQIRRRTESMCRGLTELAIALSVDSKVTNPNTRSGSREGVQPPNATLRTRRYSNDPGERNTSSRLESRLTTRRKSVQLSHNNTGLPSPEMTRDSPMEFNQGSGSRLNKSSTLLSRKRGVGYDGIEDDADASPSVRPVSRAMTDLGAYRRPSRDHAMLSREYVSQHPMPNRLEANISSSTSVSTNLGNNITMRRKYASPGGMINVAQDSSPMTPRDVPSSREPYGRISIITSDKVTPDGQYDIPGSVRTSSTRRSLGFASRIGTSVGSRLRAVRAERTAREALDPQGAEETGSSIDDGRGHTKHYDGDSGKRQEDFA